MPRNAVAIQGARYYDVPGAEERLPSVTTIIDKGWPKAWMGAWAAKLTAQTAIDYMERADELSWRWSLPHSAIGLLESDATNAHVLTQAHKKEKGDCPFTPDAHTYLKGAPWRKRDAAADHGSDVHGYLERRMTGQPYDATTPAEQAIERFLDEYDPDPMYVEAQCASLGDGYAGSFDLIAGIDGRRLLIDLKTSSYVSHEYRLQLAAYREADFIFADGKVVDEVPDVDGCAILHVPRDEPQNWQLIEVSAAWPEFVHFQHCLATFRFLEAVKNAPVGTPIPAPAQERAA